MSIISNNDPYEAIESAIKSASEKVCLQVNFKNFDLRPEDGSMIRNSHNVCRHFFDGEIANMNHQILENQDIPDLISYAGTLCWLNGYSCARDEAFQKISSKDTEISNKNAEISAKTTEISNKNAEIKRLNQELGNTRNDLTLKTKEANKLKDELEKLESTDKGQLFEKLKFYKRWCKRLLAFSALAVAVAIIIIIIN